MSSPDPTFGVSIVDAKERVWGLGPHGETAIHVDHGIGSRFCFTGGKVYVQGRDGNDHWYVLTPSDRWTGPVALPIPEPHPEPPAVRRGVVRTAGRVWQDDTGTFRPFGATLFWALRGWKFERDRVRANLAWLKAHGMDYVRILGQVGWPGNEIDPAWSDYVPLLADLLDVAYNEHGLRTEITLVGGGGTFDPMRLANNVVAAVKGREQTVMHLEVANEYFATFNDEMKMRQMAGVLFGQLPLLLAPSAPKEPHLTELQRLMDTGPYSLATVHKQRQEADRDWRFVRQNWDFKDERWPTSNNEPKGPLSSVSPCSDPLRLAMDRAVGILCGLGAYVLHNGNGIFGRPNDHPSGGHRDANVWELPNAEAIYAAVSDVAGLIPEGVENWVNANDHWNPPLPVHPLPAAPSEFWETGKGDHGTNKNYAAVGNGQFVCMPCGVLNHVTLTARQRCRIQIRSPLDPSAMVERTLEAGDHLPLLGDANANTAYIIVGQFT